MNNVVEALQRHDKEWKSKPFNKRGIVSRYDEIECLVADECTSYGVTALNEECEKVAKARKGFRSDTLYHSALKLYSLEASGQLSGKIIYGRLKEACEANGLIDDPNDGLRAFHATLSSAHKIGKDNPRYPAEREAEQAKPNGAASLDWELNLQWGDAIQAKEKDWLWPGVFPFREFSILAGPPGIGKSFIMISTAASITTGSCWPTSREKAPLGRVLYLSTEDGADDTIKPRLIACGADPARVAFSGIVRKGEIERHFSLKDDLPRLRKAIEGIHDLRLVIIDTIGNHMGGADRNKAEDVRAITAPLTAIAREYNIAIVGITHMNKSRDGSSQQKVMGSTDWVGAARAVWLVDKIDNETDIREMTPAKVSHGPDNDGYAYRLEPAIADGINTARIVWEQESFKKTADQMLQEKAEGGDKFNRAKEIILQLMKDGKILSTVANKACRDNNISQSTLDRVKRHLGIIGVNPSGDNQTWYWEFEDGRARKKDTF